MEWIGRAEQDNLRDLKHCRQVHCCRIHAEGDGGTTDHCRHVDELELPGEVLKGRASEQLDLLQIGGLFCIVEASCQDARQLVRLLQVGDHLRPALCGPVFFRSCGARMDYGVAFTRCCGHCGYCLR